MADKVNPETLQQLLQGNTPFALIDVREAGEYNSSHIPGASLIARRHPGPHAPGAGAHAHRQQLFLRAQFTRHIQRRNRSRLIQVG